MTVFNDTDARITATLTVSNLAAETTELAETTDIESSQAAKYDDIFESATEYRFEIETADGLADSYEWDLPATDHYLYITVNPDSVDFEENEP